MAISDRNTFMVTPADHMSDPSQGQWTYDDYVSIPDDGKRYEVVDGVLFMTPAPNRWHQDTVGAIFAYLWNYVNLGALGRVYAVPFDVELAPKTVFQPDITIILNKNLDRLSDTRMIGAPDLVVEVASPATANYDREQKLASYAKARIPEYWIVDPVTRTVTMFTLATNYYQLVGTFEGKNTLPSKILPAFPVLIERFFEYVQI